MFGLFEINLCCPDCGHYVWVNNNDGTFTCNDCDKVCTPEEMTAQAFDAE